MTSILWRRLDTPGHEFAHLVDGRLDGAALFLHEGAPVSLSYEVTWDDEWRSLAAWVQGWVGAQRIEVEARPLPGCVDLDLNFSPSTNMLPIRRLSLAIGQSADVRATWLRFPSFKVEPLEQRYTRLSESTYRYESAGGTFVREIEVNEHGLVTRYPGFFEEERG